MFLRRRVPENGPLRAAVIGAVYLEADPEARLLPIVQKLYSEQWKDRPETDPADAQIVADPQGGRVIVTGRPEHVKEIAETLNVTEEDVINMNRRLAGADHSLNAPLRAPSKTPIHSSP